MRINKFVASKTGLSRRAADAAIAAGRVLVNGAPPAPGQQITDTTIVTLDSKPLDQTVATQTILLNKPVGYVCSRAGQGSKTVYDLLPSKLHHVKPVGRLDKNSSGLLLMTNDGALAHNLTHPSFVKLKRYQIMLNKPLLPEQEKIISITGIKLDDGISKLGLKGSGQKWEVTMHEGRNRQIRRTFAALGYKVTSLHRTHFGSYILGNLPSGKFATK